VTLKFAVPSSFTARMPPVMPNRFGTVSFDCGPSRTIVLSSRVMLACWP
jgi:hypothetical protein